MMTMFYSVANNDPDYIPNAKLLSNRNNNEPNAPVEVKTSYDQEEEARKDARRVRRRRAFWRQLMLPLTAIVVIAAIVVAVLFLVVYPKTEEETVVPMEIHSESDRIFNYWSTTSRQGKMEEFDFNSAINKELVKYYQDLLEKHEPEYLKQFFNQQGRQLKTVRSNEEFLDYLSDLCSNRLSFYVIKLKEIKDPPIDYKQFQQFFAITEELNAWYNYLHDLREFLSSYEAQTLRSEYDKEITSDSADAFIFYTNAQFSNSKPFDFNVDERKLREVNEVVSRLTKPTDVLKNGDTIIFRNKNILLSEISKRLHGSNFSNVYVFATKTVYLDADLLLPGTNVALVSPVWSFIRNVTVCLDGKSGAKHEYNSAVEGKKGKSGNNGKNGGYFLGIGDLNEEFISISNRGGNGSDGQNGANGRNGIDGGRPVLGIEEPTCVLRIKTTTNIMSQIIVEYNVYDELGCGTSGTDGGVAGAGGRGGKTILLNASEKRVKISIGKNGLAGASGKGGKGGVGGNHGCFFKAFTIGESWNRITSTKCGNDVMPSGNPGKDNANSLGHAEPMTNPDWIVFGKVLPEYRAFAYRHYDTRIRRFLRLMDEESFFYNITEPFSFFDEMKIIEPIEDIKLYESLQRRIDLFVQTSYNHEYNKALRHLHLMVLSKISNLKYGLGNCLIIDLENYLKSITDNIQKVDKETLHTVEYAKPIMRQVFENKLQQLEWVIQNQENRLQLLFLKLDRKINDLYNSTGVLDKDEGKQVRFYSLLSRYLDAKRVVYLTKFVCNTTMSLLQITKNRLLYKDYSTDGYQELKQLLTDYQHLKETNLKSALTFANVKSTNYEDAMEEVLMNISNDLNVTGWTIARKRLYLSQILISVDELTGHEKMLERTAPHCRVVTSKFRKYESKIAEEINSLTEAELPDIRGRVELLRSAVHSIGHFYRLNENGKGLLDGFVKEIEHFETLLLFVESYHQEELLSKAIASLESSDSEVISDPALYKVAKELKERLYNMLVVSQYKQALNAFQQWIFPYAYKYDDLTPKSENITIDEALDNIAYLHKKVREYKSTISSFDKNIREAIFTTNSSVGEFYAWYNGEIRVELEDLFRGKKISLRADVENVHILNKNAIKFKTIRLEFIQKDNDGDNISQYLKNFAVEMKHSGFSYYQYRGETYIITSDDVTLYYGYELDADGQPQIVNQVYRKLQEGDILLSPYTTWTVQLQQVNIAANYEKLLEFADRVDIALVGRGSYIAETDDEYYTMLSPSYLPVPKHHLL